MEVTLTSQKFHCENCRAQLRRGHRFCNTKCKSEKVFNEYIARWKNGKESGIRGGFLISKHIRRYLISKCSNRCPRCGWGEVNPVTGKVPLEINHIDGNSENCRPENLEVLCPNCHSLTFNYGALNTGKASKSRLRYRGLVA